MSKQQAPKGDKGNNAPKQDQPGFLKRNFMTVAMIAGAGMIAYNLSSSPDNAPVAYDLMSSSEFVHVLSDGDVKSAQIEMVDGQYVVTGTLNVNDYKKPDPDAKPLSEKELKKGPKYKAVFDGASPESLLAAQNVPTTKITHDPYKRPASEIITIDDLEMLIDQGKVTGVAYTNNGTGHGTIFEGSYTPVKGYDDYTVTFSTAEHGANSDSVIKKIHDAGIKRAYIAPEAPSSFMSWIPTLLLIGAIIFIAKWQMGAMGGGGAGGIVNRKSHQQINPEDIEQGFDDVQGIDHAKKSLQQMVRYLKNPEKLSKMGGKPPKGALLSGPPGTGKTMLAKAVAKEAGVPFFSINGSDFVEMYVGTGARRARQLFEDARANSPCIIFIDEIDAVGGNRGGHMTNSHSEQQQTLTQILTAMDGFEADSGIVVLAATNRPESLDPALTRAGRLDRKIVVDVPDLAGRVKILEKYIKEASCADDINIAQLGQSTPGWPGAELRNLVNEALALAEDQGRDQANMMDFINARDNLVFGEKRYLNITDEERRLTCDHEAGHAILMKYTDGSDKILKATAVPRSKTLGMVETVFEGDKVSYNKKQLCALMDTFMAGRLAEEIFHGEDAVTTGASNDIKQATKIARQMVLDWGWSDFGMQSFTEEQRATFLSQGTSSLMDMSNEQKHSLDQQINKLIKDSEARARKVIEEHTPELLAVAEALYTYETITGEEIDLVCAGGKISRKPTEAANDNSKPAVKNNGDDQGPSANPQMRLG